MAARPETLAEQDANVLVLTRRFDAPRKLVFEAWTTAYHLARWFCPADFTVLDCAVDFRPGGGFEVAMRSPEGETYLWRNVYREIVVPLRLVYASSVLDGVGNPLFDAVTSLTFAETGGGTELTVHSGVEKLHSPEAAAGAEAMEQGWHEGLDNLAAHLADSRRG